MDPLTEVRLPFALGWLPTGFLPAAHVNILYQLAQRATSILEIGSWVGRSTCVICAAITDAAQNTPFHTVDFFIKNDEEWQTRYGTALSNKHNASLYRYFMNLPGGSRRALETHLTVRNFRDLVTVHEGDFRKLDFGRQFSLIFCDATHNIEEINLNIIKAMDLLEPGGIIACDDISHPTLCNAILKQRSFLWYHMHHSFFYGMPKTPSTKTLVT